MISYGITHAQAIGFYGLGFMTGVVFAAWRQISLERKAPA